MAFDCEWDGIVGCRSKLTREKLGGLNMTLDDLKIDIYADGADINTMKRQAMDMPFIKGFTTNPTLMKKAGVKDYSAFAKDILKAIPELPISMEVFADEFEQMEREARKIASWGDNVYVKIPVMNTRGESSASLIRRLSDFGIKLNITAVFTNEQVKEVVDVLNGETDSIISIFAGRISDAGVDAEDKMKSAKEILLSKPRIKLLWASTREVYNIIQAERAGVDIITVTDDILKKISLLGKDLMAFSKETVEQFYDDSKELRLSIL